MHIYKSTTLNFEGVPVTRSAEPEQWRLQYFVVLPKVTAGEVISVFAKGQLRNNCFVNGSPMFVEGVVALSCVPEITGGGTMPLDHNTLMEPGGGENWSFKRHYMHWRIATAYQFKEDMPQAIIQTLVRCRSEQTIGNQQIDALNGYGQIVVLRH